MNKGMKAKREEDRTIKMNTAVERADVVLGC